jgi:hypothetical protein
MKKKKKSFLRSLFDDDVWNETGKAIIYSVPTASVLISIYNAFPSLIDYLSQYGPRTMSDVLAHTFAGAGIAGYFSKLSEKRKLISKYSKLIGPAITATILIPGWESFEYFYGLRGGKRLYERHNF